MHVVILGGGDLGLAIAREAVQHGCSAALPEPPLVTVIDRAGEATKARFRAAMPRLFDGTVPAEDCPAFEFHECSAEALDIADTDSSVTRRIGASFLPDQPDCVPNDAPATAWILCCAEDTHNLTAGIRLEMAMRAGLLPPAPIYSRQWQANVVAVGRRGLGQADPLHLMAAFGGMDDVIETLSFMDTTLETVASTINAEYRAAAEVQEAKAPYRETIEAHGMPPWPEGAGPSDPDLRRRVKAAVSDARQRFQADWDELSDEGRLSNLAPAQQAALRLWELGFDWKGRHIGVLPRIGDYYIEPHAPAPNSGTFDGNETLLTRIARAEHRRWMVERALRGWAKAPPGGRSNELRLHPDFVVFEQLPKREGAVDVRAFDVATVRGTVLGLVRNTGVHARRPRFPLELEIDRVTEPLHSVPHLILRIPERPLDPEGLMKSVGTLKSWVKDHHSLTLCLRPDGPEVFDPPRAVDLRNAIRDVQQENLDLPRAADDYPVYTWLNFPDARERRSTLLGNPTPDE